MEGCRQCLSRREFLGYGAGSMAAALFSNYFAFLRQATAQDRTALAGAKCKSVIVLWMAGGPSHLDTFDPKPGKETGGEFKAIDTKVPGLQISEHLPRIAQVMDKLSVVRGMTHNEGAHERGTYLMLTGHALTSAIAHPSIGSIVSYEVGEDLDIPNYCVIGGNGPGAGFLGASHFPYTIGNAQQALQQLQQMAKGAERAVLLEDLNENFDREHDSENVEKRRAFYEKAKKLIDSAFARALDLSKEKAELVEQYGKTNFGYGCLLARRLIEAGVRFVQVNLGGWDTHQNNFESVKRLSGILDPAMAALIRDLDQRGLLKQTMVLWMGEFGRTPKINRNNGRDHYPRAFSVVVGGGGIQGGRVVGQTDPLGQEVKKDPVKVGDLLATMYGQLGIDLKKSYYTPTSGVVKITEGGAPVTALIQ